MYCTSDDIKRDFKKIDFTATGAVVTTADVEDFIEQESETINSYICNRYSVPVSSVKSPKAFLILKKICIYLVSERVKNKLEIKSGSSQHDSEEKAKNYLRTPMSDLKAIQKGELHLRDAVALQSVVSSFNIDNCVENTFDVTKQQW